MKRKLMAIALAVAAITGCEPDAQKASRNLSKAADMFELQRRIVFYNGITGEYMLVVEGRCSVQDNQRVLAVTCKEDEEKMVKHYLGLSDNVTYFSQQINGMAVSAYHNRIIWKPQSIIPNVDVEFSRKKVFGSDSGTIQTLTE